MDEPEHCQESQDLDDLPRLTHNLPVFPEKACFRWRGKRLSASPEQVKLLRAWYTFAVFLAVFAACFSITKSTRSRAQLVSAFASIVEVEESERRSLDTSSESTTARRSHSQQISQGYQGREAESDDHDIDCETTVVGTQRISSIPALREQQRAPRSDWLMTPTHLCVSSEFPRGPPTAS